MYVTLGKEIIENNKDIIGIFDLDNTSQSYLTRKFLSITEQKGKVINAAEDIPKSFIVKYENKELTVILSQMASVTLSKRIENNII